MLYLRGLMTGNRKWMQSMAERLGHRPSTPTAVHHFLTWDYSEVRRALVLRMFDEIKPEAYAVVTSGFPRTAPRHG
jgi:hypothetical protein